MSTAHRWTFFRAGDLDQVLLKTADDFRNLHQLEQQWWVALACPTKGLECDSRTLELLDNDKDGRVRVPELTSALSWTCGLLRDPSILSQRPDGVSVGMISEQSPNGKTAIASSKRILAYLGKKETDTVTVADFADQAKLFSTTKFNGDGVITPETADDDITRKTIADIMQIQGAVADRCGKPGIDQARSDAFFAACGAYEAWSKSGQTTLALGDATPAAYQAFVAVRSKIADYFSRCRLAAYDSRAAAALNRAEKDYLDFAAKDLSIATDEVVGLPLQRIEPNKPLHFQQAVNPAWKDRLDTFAKLVVQPLFGATYTALDDASWQDIISKFAPYETWLSGKKGHTVEALGVAHISVLNEKGIQARINSLITQDLALKDEVAGFEQVEKLVRYTRDLYLVIRNFVNFSDLYDSGDSAIFQAGTLYFDQRACEMCIKVADPAAHMTLAALSKMYIAYCQCTRGAEKIFIAACVTQGDGDFLMVGRNGIFYDRQGRDWDATVVKIIDNPISIRQAFWSPYKKMVRFIEDQVTKRAASAEAAADTKLQTIAEKTVESAQKGKPAQPAKPAFDVGTVAALGVGLGAIGAMVGGAITGFLNLGWWMPLGILGIILMISGPSMIIAALKIRQRTLGPVLEGTGWAINGRIRISFILGGVLTKGRAFPAGSSRLLHDPFAKERSVWPLISVIALVVLAVLALIWWQWAAISDAWKASATPATSTESTPAAPTTPPAP
jgi:hypothetical protein